MLTHLVLKKILKYKTGIIFPFPEERNEGPKHLNDLF
jgi:hypothetical protein